MLCIIGRKMLCLHVDCCLTGRKMSGILLIVKIMLSISCSINKMFAIHKKTLQNYYNFVNIYLNSETLCISEVF